MILFLTLIYCALLAILVKLKIVPLNLWWKLSPLIVLVFLNIVLFVPMQFWAPAGPVVVVQNSVAVVSNVAGQVTEVAVEPNQSVKRGDLLLKLDKEPFMAARDQLAAQLELAEIQLADSEILIKQQAISQCRGFASSHVSSCSRFSLYSAGRGTSRQLILCNSDSGTSQGWCGSGKLIQQNQGVSAFCSLNQALVRSATHWV